MRGEEREGERDRGEENGGQIEIKRVSTYVKAVPNVVVVIVNRPGRLHILNGGGHNEAELNSDDF